MSLSYVSADGTSGAASPEVLTDIKICSNVEVIIMTDRICNGDCGFVRPNSVAYRESAMLLLSCTVVDVL
jgi:hypothetical protein